MFKLNFNHNLSNTVSCNIIAISCSSSSYVLEHHAGTPPLCISDYIVTKKYAGRIERTESL